MKCFVIDDTYSIETDNYNYIIVETRHGDKGDRRHCIGFYGKLSDLVRGLVEHQIKVDDNIDLAHLDIAMREMSDRIGSRLDEVVDVPPRKDDGHDTNRSEEE